MESPVSLQGHILNFDSQIERDTKDLVVKRNDARGSGVLAACFSGAWHGLGKRVGISALVILGTKGEGGDEEEGDVSNQFHKGGIVPELAGESVKVLSKERTRG